MKKSYSTHESKAIHAGLNLKKHKAILAGRQAMEAIIILGDNEINSLSSLPNYEEILKRSVDLDQLIVQAYS